MSIVNFFHSADYDNIGTHVPFLALINLLSLKANFMSEAEAEQMPASEDTTMLSPDSFRSNQLASAATSPTPSIASSYAVPNTEVEKECVHLFFTNLHLIYYFIDKDAFLDKCDREIWRTKSTIPNVTVTERRKNSNFLALFNAVVAVGAITAGDDTVVAQSREKLQGYLDHRSKSQNPIYLPLEVAKVYFSKAKSLLGDLFEVCSLESTQTLFLMVRISTKEKPISDFVSPYFANML
jgi:hypothetical protein